MNVLRVENLVKSFNGETVLDDISFTVDKGEITTVLGPSGVGKTTLVRLLNTTLKPASGRILIEGKDPSNLSGKRLAEIRKKIGTIYQQFNLVPRVKVVHNVLAGRLGSWSTLKTFLSFIRPVEIELAHRALEEVGMEDKIFHRTDELSGGEKQRVGIARLLVQDPDIILADEPISNVDPAIAHDIMDLLVDVAEKRKKTLVTVIHQVDFALEYFPRIIGLKDGKIFFDEDPENISGGMLSQLYKGERAVKVVDERKKSIIPSAYFRGLTPPRRG